MAISTSETAREFLNIVADVDIDVPFPLFATTEVEVYYGNANAQAEYGIDYTVELIPDEFNTFRVTPTVSLISKINTLIGGGDLNANRIVVRRVMPLTTTTTPGFVQNTRFTSREFERTAMKIMQIDEQNNRAISLGPGAVGTESGIFIQEIVPNKVLMWNAEGDAIVSGEPGSGGGSGGDADTLEGQNANYYRARSNHTGTQAIGTIEGLDGALSGKAPSSHTHSIAQVDLLQEALDAKAALASPTFTGEPKAPTAPAADNSTTLATTAHVKAAISAAGGGGPGGGDATTLNGQDGDYYRARGNHTGAQAIGTVTDLQTSLDAKAPLASPALTGDPTAPTQATADDTTKIATTAHVKAAIAAAGGGGGGTPRVNLIDFIDAGERAAVYNYTSTFECNAAFAAAFAAVGSGEVLVPRGLINLGATLIIPKGVTLIGEGRRDKWNNTNLGTVIIGKGTISGSRWTDITGSDPSDDTPLMVAGGNNVWLKRLTMVPGGGRSIGILFPSVKQCGFQELDGFGFTDACVYLDATWSDRNTTLKALHPTVETDTGMNEFSGSNFYLEGGGSNGFGIKIQGTTRAGNAVANSSLWLWGWGGASEVTFSSGRLGGEGANGGCISHDGQLYGTSMLQGLTLNNVNLRLFSAGRYAAKFDRSNRVLLNNCYAESVGSNSPVIAVTSNTQAGPDGILRLPDKINADVWLNGANTGFTASNVPWEVTRCMVTIRSNQFRMFTPNIEAAFSGTVKLASFASNGNFEFLYDNGATRSSYLLVRNDVVRPIVDGALGLGTSSVKWGQIYSSNFEMPGTNNSAVPLIKSRYSGGLLQICAFETAYFRFTNSGIRPESDNSMACGTGGFRFTSLAAATSTINTSDLREKNVLQKLGNNAPLMRVAARLASETIAYQWKDAIEKKGDDARIHFGIGAQVVELAFRNESLDPASYAIWCKDYLYDSVYDEGIDKETGQPFRTEREVPRLDEHDDHAYRLGVRMDLVHILIATYHEKRQRELEARIEALEKGK